MKKIILSLIFTLGCTSARAGDFKISEPLLWENLYEGNFSLSHKMILQRPISCTNDALMQHFMLAYCFYSMGNLEQAIAIFESIDTYIETYYLKTFTRE